MLAEQHYLTLSRALAGSNVTTELYTGRTKKQSRGQRLKDLAEGLVALRSALQEIRRWDNTLILSYAEFGRRPRENLSRGTDHGTANAQFVLGGRVRGGLYGPAPGLSRLDGNGNPPFAVDFRELYATVLERWWGLDAARALGGRFASVDFVKA